MLGMWVRPGMVQVPACRGFSPFVSRAGRAIRYRGETWMKGRSASTAEESIVARGFRIPESSRGTGDASYIISEAAGVHCALCVLSQPCCRGPSWRHVTSRWQSRCTDLIPVSECAPLRLIVLCGKGQRCHFVTECSAVHAPHLLGPFWGNLEHGMAEVLANAKALLGNPSIEGGNP